MKLRRVFLDSDLRCSFEGLRKLAKEEKTPLADATVLFVNRKATAFKMLHKDAYLIYYKNGNRRIPLDAIAHLPEHFGGTELEMQVAIKNSLMQKLKPLTGRQVT